MLSRFSHVSHVQLCDPMDCCPQALKCYWAYNLVHIYYICGQAQQKITLMKNIRPSQRFYKKISKSFSPPWLMNHNRLKTSRDFFFFLTLPPLPPREDMGPQKRLPTCHGQGLPGLRGEVQVGTWADSLADLQETARPSVSQKLHLAMTRGLVFLKINIKQQGKM